MLDALAAPPIARNEPVLSYAPGSPERKALKSALLALGSAAAELPLVIGGRELHTGSLAEVRSPHAHRVVLARCHQGGPREVDEAIRAALAAKPDWAALPWTARAAVLLKAADLLANAHRAQVNAATMLGQSKTAREAEIDAACELVDFFRFNVAFARRMYEEQPESARGTWNIADLRPLEGFVLAVTPFNFTSIAANLPTAPALLGNTVVWKPSPNAAFSAHFIMKLLREAGLPDGVINLVYGPAEPIVERAVAHPSFAGLHFTGSSEVFRSLWRRIAEHLPSYRDYPRIVGETGGKDFVFAHPSADLDALAAALVRGAYEYQGQKCSAASRLYAPASLWPKLRDRLADMVRSLSVGDVADFQNFMGAVIDRRAFDRIGGHLDRARHDPACRIVAGGGLSDAEGFFVEPTLVETTDPEHLLMRQEIFGPVLTAWIYPDGEYERALDLCDRTAPYGLTGAFFAQDRGAIEHAAARLRYAAGNFYVNDKPTGAVVGQQPFGGARASGTNDKAGSPLNLWRWVSPRIIKENFVPPTDVAYPFMAKE